MPTRGTTICCRCISRRYISIHVPTRGTTCCIISFSCINKHFNPRAHEGHDVRVCVFVRFLYFNPRAHEGHDLLLLVLLRDLVIFQSTCPRGARRPGGTSSSSVVFQSTCPRGARHWGDGQSVDFYISIHVPTRGTTWWHPTTNNSAISIHVPTRGTTFSHSFCRRADNFNPRAHEGHDSIRRSAPGRFLNFNPRAHEGHDSKEYIRLILVYNSTAQFGTLEQTIIQ